KALSPVPVRMTARRSRCVSRFVNMLLRARIIFPESALNFSGRLRRMISTESLRSVVMEGISFEFQVSSFKFQISTRLIGQSSNSKLETRNSKLYTSFIGVGFLGSLV